jgi:hypothetical protein
MEKQLKTEQELFKHFDECITDIWLTKFDNRISEQKWETTDEQIIENDCRLKWKQEQIEPEIIATKNEIIDRFVFGTKLRGLATKAQINKAFNARYAAFEATRPVDNELETIIENDRNADKRKVKENLDKMRYFKRLNAEYGYNKY